MEAFIECPVCKEVYDHSIKAPLVLACGHTLCKKCALRLAGIYRFIRCPIDRRTDGRDIGQISVNYSVIQILDFQTTGILAKERCNIHEIPITIICKTCNKNCCSKCIRNHLNHDLYDIEHPTVMKELDETLKFFEKKINECLESGKKAAERIKKEQKELMNYKEEMKGNVNYAYEAVKRIVEAKRLESLNLLEQRFKEKEDFISHRMNEVKEQISYYEMHQKDLISVKESFSDPTFTDRAVTCSNLLKEMNFIKFVKPEDINQNNLRITVITSHLLSTNIPHIKIGEQSPAEVLEQNYDKLLEELELTFNLYKRAPKEQQLSLEVQSMSMYLISTSEKNDIAKLQLMEKSCRQVLGQGLAELSSDLKSRLARKLNCEIMPVFDLSYGHNQGLLVKLRYIKGLIFALQKVKESKWGEALKILHYIILSESEYDFAEYYLQVCLLRLCSEVFNAIKHGKLHVVDPLLELITSYTAFHFLPSDLCFKQISSSLNFAYKAAEASLPSGMFSEINSNFTQKLRDLKNSKPVAIPIEMDPDLGTEFESLAYQDLTFFEDLELPRILINRIHLFKEECSAWFQALRIVQDRGYVLTSDEQQALERSL